MKTTKLYRIAGKFLMLCLPFILAVAGCSRDEAAPGARKQDDGAPVKIGIKVDTRAVDAEYPGDEIGSIRLIYWKIDSETLLYNELLLPADFDEDTTPGNGIYATRELELYPGSYGFLAVSNPKGYDAALGAATTVAQLKNIQTNKIASESGSVPIDEFPPGVIVEEGTLVPFTRMAYLPAVRIGNYMTGETDKQVSTDGGSTWREDIPLALTRILSRINISVRKMTGTGSSVGISHVKDRIYITGLRLLHVPNYSYMFPRAFDGTLYNSIKWYEFDRDNGVREPNDFFEDNNAPTYTPPSGPAVPNYEYPAGSGNYYVRSSRQNIVLPEYVMSDRFSERNAVLLEVRGDYEMWNETNNDWDAPIEDVWALIPIQTGDVGGNPVYDLQRNKDYHIMLTLTRMGNLNFKPEVVVSVSDWDKDNDGYFNGGNSNVSVTGYWSVGGANPSGELYVGMGQEIEYTFSFTRTDNDQSLVSWKATLSNPVDFNLTSNGGAVTEGHARPGVEYKVRVTPSAASNTQKQTKLYINIDDGEGGVIRLPLNTADNYVIYQIPQ